MKSQSKRRISKSRTGRTSGATIGFFINGIRMTADMSDREQPARYAASLNVSPVELKRVFNFSEEVFTTSEKRGLSNGQLMTSLVAVITRLVRETGTTEQQTEVCAQLILGLWAAVGLEGPPPIDLLPASSEPVH